jgi:hypothetical protein
MDANESETRVLVGRAAAGDKAAVDALMSGHRGRLKQMVRLRMDPRLRARVDPSDVIQETLATASRQLPGYLQTQAIPPRKAAATDSRAGSESDAPAHPAQHQRRDLHHRVPASRLNSPHVEWSYPKTLLPTSRRAASSTCRLPP